MSAGEQPVILVFGDSLSAGYGIGLDQSWPSLLAQRLRREGYRYRVVNASVSGETTAGGLTRLPRVLTAERPALVILELGANDGLRGLPLAEVERDLRALIASARAADARVVLVGMRLPPNYGPAYTEAFHALYRRLARTEGVALVPFLLDGVGGHPRLMQEDGLHPRARAQARLLDNVWPALVPFLKK